MKVKYLIIGAGPTGLSIANRFLMNGETSFYVVEKDDVPGGLCKSTEVDGSPFDTGGIHLLEDGNKIAKNFLFEFMPENEWIKEHWVGKIYFSKKYIDSPFESNIWQLDTDSQVRYLCDLAKAGNVRGLNMPDEFKEWIYWKFGVGIANDYMIPYNSKMFSGFLDELGIYWLYKLPSVSFEETIRSCLEHKAYGELPGYGKKFFYYPKKYGFGEVWKRMADNLGERIGYSIEANSINFESLCVNNKFYADVIINTIPWTEFKSINGMPDKLRATIKQLKYTSVRVDYHNGHLDTDAAWVYYPESDIRYHRAMVRHNFCPGAVGYGTETNINFEQKSDSTFSYINRYTYPVNTREKEGNIKTLLEWCRKCGVIGIGRWGEWRHHNSDVVVKEGIELADKLCGKGSD